MIKRICLFVMGLFIMSLGVAFSIVSGLGTTPISSISYSLALITNLNYHDLWKSWIPNFELKG